MQVFDRARGLAGLIVLGLVVAVTAQIDAKSPSKDWPQFRGVNRNGVSLESGIKKSWPDAGPKELWRRPIGGGFSGISIVGDRGYTMYGSPVAEASQEEGAEKPETADYAAAFNAKTGEEIWRVKVGERFDDGFAHGPRSTPTVDGNQVFVLGGRGYLMALSKSDGSEQWSMDLKETFGSQLPTFGFSTSVLVDGDQVFLESGGPDGNAYAALDRKTGETRWTLGDAPESGPGYSSPIVIRKGGETRYVHVLGDKLTCMDDKGKEIWSHAWPSPGETHGSPIFLAPNRIYASGAGSVGAAVFEVDEKSAPAKVEEIWKSRFMRNHFSSSVASDGYIYGFDNATLRCISAETGESVWAKRGFGKGSLILADGHLLVLSDRGVLALIEATHEGYVEKGRVQALNGRSWTAPSLADGKLYLRNSEEMVAYDLKN